MFIRRAQELDDLPGRGGSVVGDELCVRPAAVRGNLPLATDHRNGSANDAGSDCHIHRRCCCRKVC